MQNVWSEGEIIRCVWDEAMLTRCYPDHPGGFDLPNWFILVIEGDQESTKFCELLYDEGYTVGRFGLVVPRYAVACYIPDSELTEVLNRYSPNVQEVYVGTVRVLELGRNGGCTPLMGVWNWGRNFGGPGLPRRRYHSELPTDLDRYYHYTDDAGHCIEVILRQHVGLGSPEDFAISVPVKSVLRGYSIENGYIVAEKIDYDECCGAVLDCEDYEFQY